ncbi:formylglycine-generating enzyme family protein [Methanomethylovorans sp.]|uniref:formylglycine-generating enzyme family protein n=1 Tax=Methanomethylovorans sp. TaxID=2758717 RepID=UPI003D13E0AE
MYATSMKNPFGMEFVLIPAGELRMDPNRHIFEKPANRVIIPEPFYLGKYLVTQKEWRSVMGNDPSCFEGDDRPVECVSWNDVQEFIAKLNIKEGTDKYCLPTEEEWEYACRAGTTTRYSFGDTDSKLGEYAWYCANSEHETHPVGQKKPNPWGLYDMHGNVWEWCQNRSNGNYDENLAYASTWEDVVVFSPVLRGGGWVSYPRKCRSAYRMTFHPNYGHYSLGFRLLRSV